jgi:CRISPR-associated protein Csh1
MIEVISRLARSELQYFLKEDLPFESLSALRSKKGKEIASLLVENPEKIKRLYILKPVFGDSSRVQLSVEEFKNQERVPFVKPSGAQSGAIGPALKRTASKKKGLLETGPSLKIQNTTLKQFYALSQEQSPWSSYFREIYTILSAEILCFNTEEIKVGEGQQDEHLLAATIRIIPDEKDTVLLTVADSEGRLPGERAEYQMYLTHVLAQVKYTTGNATVQKKQTCPLCGKKEQTLYPNAVKGAGFNIGNMDREGTFRNLDTSQAWKKFALCLDCADLLYIFKNHYLKYFLNTVGGKKALILPDLTASNEFRNKFIEKFHRYVSENQNNEKIAGIEKDLLSFFQSEKQVLQLDLTLYEKTDFDLVLHIIWAKFGQNIEEVSGVLLSILPSRLRDLSRILNHLKAWKHPIVPLPVKDFSLDLALNCLSLLFKRPGGKKVKAQNESKQLFEIQKMLISCIYHKLPLENYQKELLWNEWMTTGRCYLNQTFEAKNPLWSLLNEDSTTFTLAGWTRHLALFLYYLDQTGVLVMEKNNMNYAPKMKEVLCYFQEGSGLNTLEKSYAFLLGILYGKLLQVQAGRGVNVTSNALTWLKGLRLTGEDLPEFYTKIREKLLVYGTEGNEKIRELLGEIAELGIQLGSPILLDRASTCYFLLLGQSVVNSVLPSKSKNK